MVELGWNEGSLSMLFNGLLVVSILGLWAMWFHQQRQRKHVERILQLASADLQEATKLLEQVMTQMPNIDLAERQAAEQRQGVEQRQVAAQERIIDQGRVAHSKASQPSSNTISEQDQLYIQRNIQKLKATLPSKKQKTTPQPQKDNLSSKIMRLHNEGLSKESIAKRLQMPVAQVRLMLLLQTSKA